MSRLASPEGFPATPPDSGWRGPEPNAKHPTVYPTRTLVRRDRRRGRRHRERYPLRCWRMAYRKVQSAWRTCRLPLVYVRSSEHPSSRQSRARYGCPRDPGISRSNGKPYVRARKRYVAHDQTRGAQGRRSRRHPAGRVCHSIPEGLGVCSRYTYLGYGTLPDPVGPAVVPRGRYTRRRHRCT